MALSEKNLYRVLTAAVWSITFIIYRITLAPSVGYIDSGELAAVADTLGIAHPTGYPLYTLIGRIAAMLPIASSVILRLNILSAILTATAAALFFRFVLELMLSRKGMEPMSAVIAALIASFLLAFSRTFWLQGVSAEVYSLHLFLVMVILYGFTAAVNTDASRWWLLFSFAVGLAFTNHMTTVLLAPALLFWFFAEHGIRKEAFKRIGLLAVPFAAGLSVYLYLPVRASQHPLLNWGNPQSLETFLWHITGKQFRVWMFSSSDVARKQLEYFFSNLTNEFHPAVLLLALLGAGVMVFKERRKFIVVLLLMVTCIAYSINYDIHDIDSYFLLAFIAIAVFAAYGIVLVISRFDHRYTKAAVAAAGAVLLLAQGSSNWRSTDQSKNYLVEDYAKNILTSLPQNAILISSQWDYLIAASYYFQHVEKLRPDVTVLDKELFRRSWYFPQLEHMYPDLMRRSAPEAARFKAELFKFEHDLPYDYTAIEGTYTDLLMSFIQKAGESAVFITSEIEPQYVQGYLRIPEGFVLRLVQDTLYHAFTIPALDVRPYHGTDSYTVALKGIMANALHYRAAYERYYGFDSLARLYSQNASEFTAISPSRVINF